MSRLDRRVVAFARLLRSRGLEVHGRCAQDVLEALTHVDVGARQDVYHACRALMVHRREDLPAFDRAFDEFWGAGAVGAHEGTSTSDGAQAGQADPAAAAAHPGGGEVHESLDDPRGAIGVWSDASRIADKDFAAFTPSEIAQGAAALARLPWHPGWRRSRRWQPGRGPALDLRRAFTRSIRTGGDVVTVPARRRRLRPRPLVLVCDVSGSMERHSRMLVHFAHALVRRQHRVEVFLFSTALTRVTADLRARRLNTAAFAVARAVPDWSGGTRIGAALRDLHQRWGSRVLGRGAVVLLVSDGWDRGDPQDLQRQVSRLRRRSSRLIWLNPLIGTLDYAPLTRGLRAALPFVDDFLPARTLRDVTDLALHLGTLEARR
jgi:uncharacterized protein with von Willebrand factor type A (vWA) domain